MRIVNAKWLTAFTCSYGQASVLIPYVVAAPFYFLGKISMGALNQVGAAFNAVNEAINFRHLRYRPGGFAPPSNVWRRSTRRSRAPKGTTPARPTARRADRGEGYRDRRSLFALPEAAPWRTSTISP